MAEKKRQMVIIVGAGASQEFELPTGFELKQILKNNLSFRFDEFGRPQNDAGDQDLARAFRVMAKSLGENEKTYFDNAKTICANMHLAPSIDNFLDTHRENESLVRVGKMAIAHAIIQAESKSLLTIDESNIYNRLNFGDVENTWTAVFFKLIAAKRDYTSFLSALKNITFVSFNYDRCIKQFFVNAAASYFSLSDDKVQEVLNAIDVVHPYGSIGELTAGPGLTHGFAMDLTPNSIKTAADRIRTFTEHVSDDTVLNEIQQAFSRAQVVIFLGFSFLDINMQLLKPKVCHATRVLATAKGRSEDTKARLARELQRDYSGYNSAGGTDVKGVEMFGGKCFELFYEFDHFLMELQPQ